jgi:hypothetical protein
MSKTLKTILAIGCCIMSLSLQAQVRPKTNVSELQALIVEWQKKEEMDNVLRIQRATALGLPLRIEHSDGRITELDRFENDLPVYVSTTNRIAAISTATLGLLPGGATGYDLSGEGMIIGEWDGGAVRLSHQEFGGRAIQRDGSTSISNHATHVAGTLIGAGVRADAMGMAPNAILWAHDWNSDNAEMADAASRGLLVSNHSYGNLAGWASGDWANPGTTEWHWWGDVSISPLEDYKFGFYDSKSATWDQIAVNAPYYLIVKSAGNDRSNTGALNHKVFINGSWQSSSDFRPRDGGDLGYDCLPTYSNAKNILTIGAVNDLPNGYNGPSSVSISNFSSYGPTDDGRIKPDIVGNGVGLTSSTSTSDTSYGSLSGTSMSGPNVAGSLILLQELFQRYNGRFMLSSSLRGLAIQTADESGTTPGPDYRFGWGLLNSTRAANMIRDNGVFQFIDEDFLNQGEVYETKIYTDGETPVKVTLCWIDPAGIVSAPALNDRTPKLVNDLDMRLISEEDTTEIFLPYLLNPDNPAAAATKGDNFRDNIEQIDAGILPKGTYTIRISHKGNLRGGVQTFSLLSNMPKTPCQLGIAEDIKLQLPCNQVAIDEFIVPALSEEAELEYSIDNDNFTDSPVFTDLGVGTYQIWMRDNQGCIGIQRVQVIPEVVLELGLVDEFLFYAENETQRFNLAVSSSISSGWGADPNNVFLSAPAIFANDGSANSTLGCSDLINSSELRGNIAIFDRGSCEFSAKALRAQQAGAVGAIIINNTGGSPIQMAGGAAGNLINIPVFMITQNAGNELRSAIETGDIRFTFGLSKALKEATCPQLEDGAIRPSLIAGNLDNVTILWSNGTTTLENNNLAAGAYSLTITGEDGCENTFDYVVPAKAEPTLEFLVKDESCLNDGNGSLNILNLSQLNRYEIRINNLNINDLDLNNLLPGRYDVMLRDTANNCQYFYDFEINEGVVFDPGTISGEDFVYESLPYSYSVDEVNGATYFWTIDNGNIINGQGTNNIEVVFLSMEEEGSLSAEIQVENCIQFATKPISIYTASVVSLTENERIKIYPNPFSESVVLDLELSKTKEITIELLDILKNPVWKKQMNNSGKEIIQTQHLIPGMYILRISTPDHQRTYKLLKQ